MKKPSLLTLICLTLIAPSAHADFIFSHSRVGAGNLSECDNGDAQYQSVTMFSDGTTSFYEQEVDNGQGQEAVYIDDDNNWRINTSKQCDSPSNQSRGSVNLSTGELKAYALSTSSDGVWDRRASYVENELHQTLFFDPLVEDTLLTIDINVEGTLSNFAFQQIQLTLLDDRFGNSLGGVEKNYEVYNNTTSRVSETFTFSQLLTAGTDQVYLDLYSRTYAASGRHSTENGLVFVNDAYADFGGTSWLNVSFDNPDLVYTPAVADFLSSPRPNISSVEVAEPKILSLFGLFGLSLLWVRYSR